MTSSATLRVLENGALKTGTPCDVRRVEIDLVGADAEAADRQQSLGVFVREDFLRDVRLRADAEDVDAVELRSELLGLERLLQELDLEGLLLEEILRTRVDAFEQENLQLVLRQGVTHRASPLASIVR